MDQPDVVPSPPDAALQQAAQQLVFEFFSRVDAVDIDAALSLYAEDATFLRSRGRAEIRRTMQQGLAANANRRTRHVIANLRAERSTEGQVRVDYTALAYTLDGDGPLAPRTILDQQMVLRIGPDRRLSIAEHQIPGFTV